jgi:D-tyrosyl-tRNA(Tyr) deacylase
MKIIVQRVSKASVSVENQIVGKINAGLMILVAFNHTDDEKIIDWFINKIIGLRIFNDENDKMNLSIKDINGEILLISNFTLYGEAIKGFRPSFVNSAPAETAIKLYVLMLTKLKKSEIKTESGIFGADMKVELVNDGPVTIDIEKSNK